MRGLKARFGKAALAAFTLTLVATLGLAQNASADDNVLILPGFYLTKHRTSEDALRSLSFRGAAGAQSFSLACDSASVVELLRMRVNQLEALKIKLKKNLAADPEKTLPIFEYKGIFSLPVPTRTVSYAKISESLFVIYVYRDRDHSLTAHVLFNDLDAPKALGTKFLRTIGPVGDDLYGQDLGAHCVALQNAD